MIARKSGAILNVASTAAFQPGPGMAVYFATKAFVLSLTEALHEELKPHGIKVSCLCPGPTAHRIRRSRGIRQPIGEVRQGRDERRERWSRPGSTGSDKNRAVVIPGLLNKVGAASTRFASARAGSQNRRRDQILISKLNPRRAPPLRVGVTDAG